MCCESDLNKHFETKRQVYKEERKHIVTTSNKAGRGGAQWRRYWAPALACLRLNSEVPFKKTLNSTGLAIAPIYKFDKIRY